MRKEWTFKEGKYLLAVEFNYKKFVSNALGYLIKDDKFVVWFGALIFRVEFEIAKENNAVPVFFGDKVNTRT